MRSAHIFYRSLTVMAEAYEGTDGVLIIRPRNEFIEHAALFGPAILLSLLAAISAAC